MEATRGDITARTGQLLDAHSGDACSAFGIAGAATLVANHRAIHLPAMEHTGGRLVLASMAAAGVDTAIQSGEVLTGRGEGTPGTVAYAATGLIPATSIAAYAGIDKKAPLRAKAGAGLLALNGAVLGYELLTRGPRILSGDENLSGYGSLAASLGGFVVTHRMVR